MTSKKFSIVIPTYNHCDDLLRPCIESLLNYTNTDHIEIVVVANGCTDNTREYVESLGSIARLVWHNDAIGYTRAANEGIRASRGEFVLLLNNDTEILPSARDSWLQLLYQPFVNNDKMMATGTLKLYDHDVENEFLVFCCVLVRRSAFNYLGLLDEVFSPGYGEDIDFCMRMLDAGLEFKCVDETKLIGDINVGSFPLWHKSNKTFEAIPEYTSVIVKRNQEILRNRYKKRKINFDLNHAYEWCRNIPSDIFQHIHTLRRYARECEHITELRTGHFISYYGLAAGLPKKIVAYDINHNGYYDVANPISKNNNIELVYKIEDTKTANIESTDLIFFNSSQNYQQLKIEINKHADLSKKYLIFHNTEAIWPVIQEFLDSNPTWQIKEKFIHNNGLIVLERINIDQVIKSTTRPKYSIIIPTYNHCDDLLRPCIESIKEFTTLEDTELIVVANGCTDNTREYVESLGPWAQLIWDDQPLGYPKACNLGIRAATGEFIILLNNDTVLLPQAKDTWLNMLNRFFEDPTVGLVSPLRGYDPFTNTNILIFFYVMIRREVFDQIGLLDEIFSPGGCEDIDFSFRAERAGFRCVQATEDVVYNEKGQTHSGGVPIYHKNNKTFGEMPEYHRTILRGNNLINLKRWNKNIRISIGPEQFKYNLSYCNTNWNIPDQYFPIATEHNRAVFWMPETDLNFDENTVSEILVLEHLDTLDQNQRIKALNNWYHVLKPGGQLIIEYLDIEKVIDIFNFSTSNAKIELATILNQNRGGFLLEQLINQLDNTGFVEFKTEKTEWCHNQIFNRITVIKPQLQ
jgi:GT2 family glycosyltransferase